MLKEEVLMFFESVESITTLSLIIHHQPISNKNQLTLGVYLRVIQETSG